jgi:hypothetical protein
MASPIFFICFLGDIDVDTILVIFEDACRKFTAETKIKPLLIVEDIHHCRYSNDEHKLNDNARVLVGWLVRFHNAGLINVVYTISDNIGEKMLRQGLL